MDTSEQATQLIRWYEQQGYRHVGYADWDVTNYRSVVLSKAVNKARRIGGDSRQGSVTGLSMQILVRRSGQTGGTRRPCCPDSGAVVSPARRGP